MAAAQMTPSPADLCTNEIDEALSRELRLYRSAVYGKQATKDEPEGATWYDTRGVAWIKTAPGSWKTEGQGQISDSAMEERSENDFLSLTLLKSGILRTKGVLTSDLIPALLQSMRALRCRTTAVCDAVQRSVNGEADDGGGFFRISTPGCRELPVAPLFSCRRTESASDPSVASPDDTLSESVLRTHCQETANRLMTREMQMLRLAVAYDGYRSFLQFAGMFDDFLGAFSSSIASPLRQLSILLQEFHRIPCLISQCG